MHTFSETGAGVPAFLAKLWRLVEDPETNNLICWSKDGRSFIIQNQAQFARELLPLNYKHNNMASFIRQLNMYGFHKITSIDNGGLKFDRDEMEFTHPCFKRNCPYLLEHIKRKIASTKSVDEKSGLKPEAVTRVLQDVKAMRGRQDSLDSRFSVMKQENEALWREIASLRQKHAKQQQIVNKLIQFLITIVQPQRNMTSVKRHMQLMINDIPDKTKIRKTSESDSKCGPVIHELGEELLDEVSEVEQELMDPNSPFVRVSTPGTPIEADVGQSPHNLERPSSSVSMISQNFDVYNQSAEDSGEYLNVASTTGVALNEGLIQTVNNDGSKIFYHITEVPDAHPQETTASPVSYNEDNVLTTPMVREENARNQFLKLKNRQKRFKDVISPENRSKRTMAANAKIRKISPKGEDQNIHQTQTIQIKSENDSSVDPMDFLNVYPNNRSMTPDPNLLSPICSEDSHQSNSNTGGGSLISSISATKAASPTEDDFFVNNSSDLYNPNNFITNDIPADIFEDNSLTSNEEKVHFIKNDNSEKTQQQQQVLESTISSGNSTTYSTEPTLENGSIQPSTSAAAAAANFLTKSNNGDQEAVTALSSPPELKGDNFDNMTITKYGNNQNLMRNEVSGHLDIVQDELEGLKDLLRSDVYSLDNNTLLGMPLNETNSIQNPKLSTFEKNNHVVIFPPAVEEDILNKLFNEADVLGPYGLHLINDESNNGKKGSELITYQPMYDLSDIINDQNDLDGDANIPTSSSTLQTQLQEKQDFNSSVLNTPHHE